MRAHREGQPIPGTEGVVRAADVEAVLRPNGIGGEPKPAPLPPSPAEARRAMSGEAADDLAAPDYEASVVDDPAAIANALGLRPDDFDPTPLGSMPEGQHFAPAAGRVKIEPRPERAHRDEASATPSPAADAAKAELAADFRAHAQKVAAMAEDARGDAAKEAKVATEIAASRELGEALKARGVL